MTKRYTIKITETGQERRIIGKQWEQGAGKKSNDDDGWGYTPETETTRDYERCIYQQTVDDLALADVIAVVNGISRESN